MKETFGVPVRSTYTKEVVLLLCAGERGGARRPRPPPPPPPQKNLSFLTLFALPPRDEKLSRRALASSSSSCP